MASSIAYALAAAVREILERRAVERAEQRAKMTLVKGGRRGGQAA